MLYSSNSKDVGEGMDHHATLRFSSYSSGNLHHAAVDLDVNIRGIKCHLLVEPAANQRAQLAVTHVLKSCEILKILCHVPPSSDRPVSRALRYRKNRRDTPTVSVGLFFQKERAVPCAATGVLSAELMKYAAGVFS